MKRSDDDILYNHERTLLMLVKCLDRKDKLVTYK